MIRSLLLSATCLASLQVASAKPITVRSVSASSVYPEEEGVRYDARQLKDGKATTSWIEGDKGGGLGSWVELELGSTQAVSAIKVWGGLWYSDDFWNRANRPDEIELSFSDGQTELIRLENKKTAKLIRLKKTHQTSSVKLKIKSFHSGNTWLDTAISEVQLFDDQPDSVVFKSHKSSSHLPEDDDGTYVAENTVDGLRDTMWCEGQKEGDGQGEWLEYVFDGPTTVRSLKVINGMGGSMSTYMKGNRLTKATVVFSDGSSETISLKSMSFLPQLAAFSAPHTTSSVKLSFTGVFKGKEFNDLCISELSFK